MYRIIDFLYNYNIPSSLALKLATKFDDKIFLLAEEINQSKTSTNVFLNSNKCLVFLNEKVKKQFVDLIQKYKISSEKIEKIPTINDIRNRTKPGTLMSSSTIVLDKNNKILLLKRDQQASIEANKWQIPGGRMDISHPMYVAKAEIDQEITIINKKTKKRIYTSELINDDNLNLHQTNIFLDKKLIHITHSIKIFDQENSTIELFYIAQINTDEKNTYCRDKEFSREINFFTFNEINDLEIPLVNYLDKYKNEIFSTLKPSNKFLQFIKI